MSDRPGDERYVALLRGINVGGRNLIRMADLVACFESNGYRDVVTYIQSGNVLFSSPERSEGKLAATIQAMIGGAFDHDAPVAVRSRRRMRAIVADAPDGFGEDPAAFRYDVLYLMPPLVASRAVADVPIKEGVDHVAAGRDVLYHRRLASRASQSRLSRIVALPMYQSITIRNWNTTVRLSDLITAG
jgi:uncharacterized protein (DUF1697 family)